MTRICLWSSPRNVSTAMMYAFAQRRNIRVFDETLYPHFLLKTGAQRPDREETLSLMENDGNKVIEELILGDYGTEEVFFKEMPHFLIDLPLDFLAQTRNFFLIRPPEEILASYSKVVKRPTLADIGQKDAYDLFLHLEKMGQNPVVATSRQVLENPKATLTRICEGLDIDFQEEMLSWPAGPRPEDGPWAKYWYHNLHKSTGFQPWSPREIELDEYLTKLAAECRPFYEYLEAKSES